MNRSGIEWCEYTWNPITGCRHGCDYCYAERMTTRFSGDVRLNKMAKQDYTIEDADDGIGEIYVLDKPMLNETGKALVYPFEFEPTFHRYRINVPNELKMGHNIFVGAMADMFGSWVPDEWIREVIGACMEHPQHNYLFLTKNPERYTQYGVPTGFENLWYGTSITKEVEMCRFNSLPAGCRTFVSMEPILEDLQPEHHNILFKQVDWLIMGAETGRANRVVPILDWIKKILILAAQEGVPVFMKDSLIGIVGKDNMRQDFPQQLMRCVMSKKVQSKLYDKCYSCKQEMKKSDMLTLMAREERGGVAKQYGFMCPICFRQYCEKHDLKIPNFKKLEESTNGKRNGKQF